MQLLECKSFTVCGEYPTILHNNESSVLIEIRCNTLSDAREVLLSRQGIYKNLQILDAMNNPVV